MAAPSDKNEMSKNDENATNSTDASTEREALTTAETTSNDEDLNELLDSALKDFQKPVAKGEPVAPPPCVTSPPTSDHNAHPNTHPQGANSGELFEDLFSGGEGGDDPAMLQFGAAMRQFMEQDPDLMEEFDKLMKEAASKEDADLDAESHKDFTDKLYQTLSGMAPPGPPTSQASNSTEPESDFMKAFSGLNVDPGGGAGGAVGPGGAGPGDLSFIPMVQGMMHTLMSKEVLYPALKEMSAKYPDWLTAHESTLEPTQLSCYRQQLDIMHRICGQFEDETSNDSEETKTRRFETIVMLMQQMQDLGQPPKEIVGEMAPGLQVDDNGLPIMPGSQTTCVLM